MNNVYPKGKVNNKMRYEHDSHTPSDLREWGCLWTQKKSYVDLAVSKEDKIKMHVLLIKQENR